MEKFIRLPDAQHPQYVSYMHFSSTINFVFKVFETAQGEIGMVCNMEKMKSPTGDFRVSETPGNITKEEFTEAVNKVTNFLKA